MMENDNSTYHYEISEYIFMGHVC